METAWVWAKRSTCFRMNVGAVVVIDNRIVSHGYNGQEPGAPHCPGNSCPGIVPGNCNTIHAEANALARVPASLLGHPKHLYTTHMPCIGCAELMISADVRKLFYAIPYRIKSGVDRLISEGVEVYIVTPAGYVVSHRTNEVVEMP
jgi:dCMP deaminase